MESTFGLMNINIFKTLKKHWKLIVLLTLTAALISGLISYLLIRPVYQVSTQMLVNQKNANNQIDLTQLHSNIELINTYRMIIKSPAILEKAVIKLDHKKSVEELNRNITINSQDNSQVFSLIVEDSNPGMAAKIANTVSETFQKELPGIMSIDNVSILAKAELKVNASPIKPRPLFNIAIAVVIGLVTSIGISLIIEALDNTLEDDQDVAEFLGLPILGSIQKMSQVHKKGEKDFMNLKIGSENYEAQSEK